MIAQKRGKNVAITGAVLQTVITAVMVLVWLMTRSQAIMACTWMVGGGIAIWLVVALLFYARQMERQETLEIEEIDQEGRLFEGADKGELRPAAARLAAIERWVVPIFTLLWAAYNATIAIFIWKWVSRSAPELINLGRGAMFVVLAGFAGFLFSRYSTGMGTQKQWRPLRATGSYSLINVLMVLIALVGLLLALWKYPKVDRYIAYTVPLILLVLSVELVISFILDIYRPRIPGEEPRLCFDSRLLNLLSEPGRVGHSLADTVNYQFGFEVSKTWFYKLLIKSFVPLIVGGILVLMLLSSVLIVRDGEVYVISHLGKIQPETIKEPGLRFKLPWPIETAKRFDTTQVHQLLLGAGEARGEEERKAFTVQTGTFKGRELMLWTAEHGERVEEDFLIAVPPRAQQLQKGKKPVAAVNIIKLVAVVHYRVTDPYKFGYQYTDAGKLLEWVANQEMVRYCSSATLTDPIVNGGVDRPEALMTYGQVKAAKTLRKRIEDVIGSKGMDLGIEIVDLGFVSVHPPMDAAKEYEKVIEARLRQRETRYKAQAEATKILSEVSGDFTEALRLAFAIEKRTQLGDLKALDVDGDFHTKLNEYISYVNNNVETLTKTIEDERLEGKIREGDKTTSQILVDDYRAYLTQLQKLQKVSKDEAKRLLASYESDARKQADEMFALAAGEPAEMVALAQSYRWKTALTQRADADAFSREMLLYNACPEVYLTDRWLDVWDQVLPKQSKYVLGVSPDRVEHWMRWELESTVMQRVFGQEQLEKANK